METKVTPERIDEVIEKEDYIHIEGSTVTLCVLTLKNGFTVIGESASASIEKYDLYMGKEIAYMKAKEKIWPLEGYLLRQKLYEKELENGRN
jgi:hypothetical protein